MSEPMTLAEAIAHEEMAVKVFAASGGHLYSQAIGAADALAFVESGEIVTPSDITLAKLPEPRFREHVDEDTDIEYCGACDGRTPEFNPWTTTVSPHEISIEHDNCAWVRARRITGVDQ